MIKTLVGVLAIGGWALYTMSHHVEDPKITEKDKQQAAAVHHLSKADEEVLAVSNMSHDQFWAWVSKQNPHEELPPEKDTFEHYDQATLDGITAMMNKDGDSDSPTSSSAQDTLNSGDANYTGSSDDSSVGSVQDESGSKVTVPAGYHWVSGYTTKRGVHVKGHLSRNKGTKKKSSASTDLSKPTFTHHHDVEQRSITSKQDFPSATISGSDPTIIIGTH
jgi:hypothetical protein